MVHRPVLISLTGLRESGTEFPTAFPQKRASFENVFSLYTTPMCSTWVKQVTPRTKPMSVNVGSVIRMLMS